MNIKISDKLHKRLKKLVKKQGITMNDVVIFSVEYYLMRLESQASMEPDKLK